jgi:S-methylmethionine-dependent homocysteine/selenocysteine methylase
MEEERSRKQSGRDDPRQGAAVTEAELRLRERLDRGPPLLLDGATGTELEARGIPSELPLWSAHALLKAPEVVSRIHADYVEAGAEIITANTFRTQRRTLESAGIGPRADEFTRLAVALARRAADAGAGRVLVAGSAPTLEDCYRPDRVPEPAACRGEHAEHAGSLAAAGVDLILVETMNSIREATAAAHAASEVEPPFFVSFICSPLARLLSGEPLAEAVSAVAPFGPLAVLVNCLPPSAVAPCLEVLGSSGRPFGVYSNLGAPEAGGRTEQCTPAEFAEHASGWVAAGARVVGGCCGTAPAHIRAVWERLVAASS